MKISNQIKKILDSEAKAINSVEVNDSFVKALEILESCQGKILSTGMGKAGLAAIGPATGVPRIGD